MAVRINGFLLLQVLFLSALLILPSSSGEHILQHDKLQRGRSELGCTGGTSSLTNAARIVNEGFKDGMDPIHLLHKNGVGIYSRKLWRVDAAMQDYDDAGPNPKHDPRRRPGSGRNP